MAKYIIQKAIFNRKGDSIRIEVEVRKVQHGNYTTHVQSFAGNIYPPNWFMRTFFGATFQGDCDKAMENMLEQARDLIQKLTMGDDIRKHIREKYKDEQVSN